MKVKFEGGNLHGQTRIIQDECPIYRSPILKNKFRADFYEGFDCPFDVPWEVETYFKEDRYDENGFWIFRYTTAPKKILALEIFIPAYKIMTYGPKFITDMKKQLNEFAALHKLQLKSYYTANVLGYVYQLTPLGSSVKISLYDGISEDYF